MYAPILSLQDKSETYVCCANSQFKKRIRCCLQTKRKVFSHQNSKKAEISSIHTFQSHFLSCFLQRLPRQEHQLPFLFPFKDLDLGSLATGYALLRLPRLKEILGKQVKGFQQSEAGVEWCSSCFQHLLEDVENQWIVFLELDDLWFMIAPRGKTGE